MRLRLLTPLFIALAVTAARDVIEGRQAEPEQAALRRVATLVAGGASPEDLFAAVVAEVGAIFDWPWVGLMRYEADDSFVVVATWGNHPFPVGSRWPLDGPSTFESVRRTGQPARIADYEGLPGTVAEAARAGGIVGGVGAPIVVNRATWGVIAAPLTAARGIPEGAEIRLSRFTELVAMAIANVQARDDLRGLAAEQAALRRVATLVAEGATAEELYAGVATEVAEVLGVSAAVLDRYEPDGSAVRLAASHDREWTAVESILELGKRWPPEPGSLIARVYETGDAARVDDYSGLRGVIGETVRRAGVGSGCAAPIVVDGSLWGAIRVFSREGEPLPADAETRLGGFTELVATAIANAEAGAEVERLAEEQAALRRVAELVAGGSGPEEVFRAVSAEVGVLFGSDVSAIVRFEDDGMATVLGDLGGPHEAGARVELDPGYVVHEVRETSRSARFDTDDPSTADMSSLVRSLGIRSAVASPIVVEGELWGAITAASLEGPLAPGAERRLNEFTALLATAIANTQSREQVTTLAEEQAALRHIATLVAQGLEPGEIFAAVADVAANSFGCITSVHRFEQDESVIVGISRDADLEIGSRRTFMDGMVSTKVHRTGRSARLDEFDWSSATGDLAETGVRLGIVSQVGSPITVEGHLWGAMTLNAWEPLPLDTEERLERFTDLVATALGNAESREALRLLAEEQAALRRVAELVAGGSGPEEVFRAVSAEVSVLLGSGLGGILRFDDDGMATVLGNVGGPYEAGARVALHLGSVVHVVRETSRSARFDTDDPSAADASSLVHSLGIRSQVASPIVVEGELWGAITTASLEGPLVPGAERRLNEFTALLATAIANTQAREQVTTLADEQEALRRVATLVARGVPPAETFAAVSEEVGRLFGSQGATIDLATAVRFDPGPEIVLVGASRTIEGLPLQARWEPPDLYASTRVLRTGQSARIDESELDSVGGPVADSLRRMGLLSQVASPIIVEGDLWGAITLNARDALPPEAEQRLEKFTELVATAIANAEGKSELAASRMRIVTASDEARRRIERDLHDGMQQRLVTLGLRASAAQADHALEEDGLRAELARVATGLAEAVESLQELSRGIHPAILSEAGLRPALKTLAMRSAIPVSLAVGTDERFPEPIEIATYFVVSEALANAAKHAQASRVDVALGVDGDSLRLTIRDDGVGGVDSARGTGLVGLTDRVQALGGSLEIQSNTGTGTRLVASFPLSGDAARDGDGVAAATAPERSSDVIASSRASRSTD